MKRTVWILCCLALAGLVGAGCPDSTPKGGPTPPATDAGPTTDASSATDAGAATDASAAPDAGAAPSPDAGGQAPDARKVEGMLDAPERYERLVPRMTWPFRERYGDMCYEGNNLAVRGPEDPSKELYEVGGEVLAQRWRSFAQGVGCVFVLRDSLYSQQDHPTKAEPYAVTLPPSWVSVAAQHAKDKTPLKPLTTFSPENDAAWSAIKKPEDLFGSFPQSKTLFELATQNRQTSPARLEPQILHARKTLKQLADDVTQLIRVAGVGPEAVAEVGGERISASDRRYFTDELRRDRVIPIYVENPTPHEVTEGKGLIPEGQQIAPEVSQVVRDLLFRRRLRDGDLAVERYDISKPEERKRAIAMLEALIPKGEPERTKVWLWVTGPLDPDAKLQGQDAVEWVGSLRLELEDSKVNLDRLRLLSKPSVALPTGSERVGALEDILIRYGALDLPVSVNMTTEEVQGHIRAAKTKEDAESP